MATAAVAATSSGKDAVAEGLLDLMTPAIQQLDLHVHSVRYARPPGAPHARPPGSLSPQRPAAPRRLVTVRNVSIRERLRRLNHNVAKETARRKTMLEASGAFASRSPSKP
ncbi:SNARE-associated protein Snapin [Liparis tanakae]|uniref:SNARE-associated protein Snapin n=1 Tax=Liparis tanakae TaxID=230148 RepID=A0A4Z2EM67_9TELE|nr:SNARE-associated protein Snapin [Liparis tanakae]